jgi:hypothetical protein
MARMVSAVRAFFRHGPDGFYRPGVFSTWPGWFPPSGRFFDMARMVSTVRAFFRHGPDGFRRPGVFSTWPGWFPPSGRFFDMARMVSAVRAFFRFARVRSIVRAFWIAPAENFALPGRGARRVGESASTPPTILTLLPVFP